MLFFMSFVCQKAKTFSGALPPEPPKGLCHGPAGGLPPPPSSRTPAAFRATLVFHAHIIWAPSALPMSTFFSV